MDDVRKNIRFIDSHYNTLFNIKDGDSIKITFGYNREDVVRKCRFIDETHTMLGKDSFHICQFAELMEKSNNKYEPVAEQQQLLNIISADYGEQLKTVEIPMTEAAIKKLVGGKYDITPLNKEFESGYAVVHGTTGIAVCGIKDGTLTSIHPYWEQKYMDELSPAERPAKDIPVKKPSVIKNLKETKTALSSRNTGNPSKQKLAEAR